MNDDPRYNSGTSLDTTRKEDELHYLERLLGDFDDETWHSAKKAPLKALTGLRKLIEKALSEKQNGP